MKRKIEKALYEWKSDKERDLMIVTGPGQIGKTYSIEEFGRSAYKEYLRLDLSSNTSDRELFEDPSETEVIRRIGMAHGDFHMVPGESLLFIDDAQARPDVLDMAPAIAEAAGIDVIVAGMLPVDTCRRCLGERTACVRMFPMDFEEFLWANGVSQDRTRVIRSNISGFRPVSDADYTLLRDLFRRYLIVGGLPKTVESSMAEGGTGHEIKNIKADVTSRIHSRIMREAPRGIRERAYDCYMSIPGHLRRDNKRFRYTDVSGGRGEGLREYEAAVEWLRSLGVVNVCRNLRSPEQPFEENVGRGFKMYSFDTGLLMGLYEGADRLAFYNGDTDVDRGGALENGIACMLETCGYDLYYYEHSRRREDGSRDDIKTDFLVSDGGPPVAVELRFRPSRSPGTIRKFTGSPDYTGYGITRLVRLEDSNVHVDADGIVHLPFFASAFFDSLLWD